MSCTNGTTAVTVDLNNSASPAHVQLVAMGSYTGTYSFTEKISSVPVDIDDFYRRDSLSLELIVSLPYLKPQTRRNWTGVWTSVRRRLSLLTTGTFSCFRDEGDSCGINLSGVDSEWKRSPTVSPFPWEVETTLYEGGGLHNCGRDPHGFSLCPWGYPGEDTVLLSDDLYLNPDFVVLGKFLGCGVVLQDKTTSQREKNIASNDISLLGVQNHC